MHLVSYQGTHPGAQSTLIPRRPIEDAPPDRLVPSALVPAGRVIFWQDDAQGQEIEIVRGVVRAVRLLENGSRQILAFFWPGETILPTPAESQLCTVEAVTTCRLRCSHPLNHASAEAASSGSDQVLRKMLPLMLAIGKKTTIPRIAWLLLRIRSHLPRDQRRPDAQQIVLPRADMADYLGTTVETVSRTLAEFKAKGLIDLPTRKTIRFLDTAALNRVAEG